MFEPGFDFFLTHNSPPLQTTRASRKSYGRKLERDSRIHHPIDLKYVLGCAGLCIVKQEHILYPRGKSRMDGTTQQRTERIDSCRCWIADAFERVNRFINSFKMCQKSNIDWNGPTQLMRIQELGPCDCDLPLWRPP